MEAGGGNRHRAGIINDNYSLDEEGEIAVP
jgi:hypothetical protein